MPNSLETAVLAGGCFWCTEAVFQRLKGVKKVTSGYSGGNVPNPTYEQVSSGATGHAEALKVEFDPSLISYNVLLDVFFSTHDPTTLNRQGNDVGEQYRSVIFYSNERQRQEAEEYIKKLGQEKIFSQPIVTQVRPLENFYEAESYHKDYYNTHPEQAYCQVVINPKLEKLRKSFGRLLE